MERNESKPAEFSAGPSPSEEGPLVAKRFRLLNELKRGALVTTYLALDLQTGESVVVKRTAGPVSAKARERLAYEAAVLRELARGDVVTLRFLEYDGASLTLAYPYVPGMNLAERLTRGPLTVRETICVGLSLLATLRDAHDVRVVHGDVKPTNVIVAADGEVRGATLIDFGLARSTGDFDESALCAGTAAYMAPEQAGLIESDVDGRADLYSTGVLLHECLTGERAIRGATLGDVLRNHLLAPPARLREFGIDVPTAFDEILQRLFRRDPRDRYQRAEGAFADLKELETLLERGSNDPPIAVGVRDRRSQLTEPAFVGRSRELDRLRHNWDAACRGDGGLVLLEAESGGGKTRLLTELATRCAVDRGLLFQGQGVDQAAQSPFQLLSGVAERIQQLGTADPAWIEGLIERLAAQRDAVAVAMPALGPALGGTSTDGLGPEDFGEMRSLQALTTLLDRLGTAERPALVLLDDCQWADGPTLKLLHHWHRRIVGGERHVLVVAAFRSEQVRLGHALRRMKPESHLRLAPLTEPEINDIVQSMAGPVPPQVTKLVVELAEGSPFMTDAVLRGLVESGALVATRPGAWTFDESRLGRLSSSRKAATFLVRRLELMPPSHIALLSVAAVLGKEFSLDLVATLAGQTLREAYAVLEEARQRHIVWGREAGNYSFVHDKLREALLMRLAPAERGEWHRLAASHLQTKHPDRVFEIAYHFDAAGESRNALPFALTAAEQARERHSLEIAEQQYRIAERGVEATDVPTALRIAEGLGDVLLLRGDYSGAEKQFERTLSLTEGELEKARIEGKIGELLFKRGDVEAAARAVEGGLRRVGRYVPSSRFWFLVCVVREIVVQTFHTLFPSRYLARKPRSAATEADLLEMKFLSRLAYIYWFGRGAVPCMWAHLREMNFAERYPPGAELAQAYSEHAPVMSIVPWWKRGVRYAEKSLQIRQQLGDLWGQGQSLHFLGVVHYAASHFHECIRCCREAVRIMERTGDRWEVNTANWHISFCLHRLGDYAEAAELARQVYRDGAELGDHQAAGIGLSGWARASRGNVSSELIAKEIARDVGDGHTRVELLFADGVRLLEHDRNPSGAVKRFEEAVGVIKRFGLRQEYALAVLPWVATALRREGETLADLSPIRRDVLRRRQRRAVRAALRAAYSFRNQRPHALRESAFYWAARGRIARAHRDLTASIDEARRQKARGEMHQSLLARAALGREMGWNTVEQDLAEAQNVQPTIARAAVPAETSGLSLADRFETLLETGRRLAAATTRDEVRREACRSLQALLRSEAALFLVRDEQGSVVDADGGTTGFARRPAESALLARRPVVVAEGIPDGTDAPTESLVFERIRSALYAPVLVRGEPVGCLYASHRGLGRLFGRDEERLASFVGGLAGAALESVEALEGVERSREELARSNEDLERFAYAASHDLKEPLRMTTIYLQLLHRAYGGRLDDKANDYIGYAVEGNRRLNALIDGLLEFSRVRSESCKRSPVELSTVVEEMRQSLRAAIDESGAELIVNRLPVVSGNQVYLLQLFQNLVSNALKFRKKDEPPRIRIEAARQNGMWRVAVTDNGIGIDPQYFEWIFRMFQRIHQREEYPGNGIGLALCRRIVELHGGTIGVSSAPGAGATFWFTLPPSDN